MYSIIQLIRHLLSSHIVYGLKYFDVDFTCTRHGQNYKGELPY